jgi:hypothetical protein
MLYVTTERYILPKLYDPTMSEPRVILELLFPFLINYLFIFYIIFECILNAFAELSRYASCLFIFVYQFNRSVDLPTVTFMMIGGTGKKR